MFNIVKSASYNHVRSHIDNYLKDLIPPDEGELSVEHLRSLFFGNYSDPDADPKIYDEVFNFIIILRIGIKSVYLFYVKGFFFFNYKLSTD